MKTVMRLQYAADERANEVCAENAEFFDGIPGAQKTRLALDGYVTESRLQGAVIARARQLRRAAVLRCGDARAAGRKAAKAVVRVGKLVKLPDSVMNNLALPGQMSDHDFLFFLQGLLDLVRPFEQAFAAEGMPPNVLNNLAASITELRAAKAAKDAATEAAAAAAEKLNELHRLSATAIAALEAIAVNVPEANPEVVTKLRVAMRVGPRSNAGDPGKVPGETHQQTPADSTAPASMPPKAS